MSRTALIAVTMVVVAWLGSAKEAAAEVAGESYLSVVTNLSGGGVQLLLNFDDGAELATFTTRGGGLGTGIYSETGGLMSHVTAVFAPNPTLTSFQAVNLTFAGAERLLGVGFGNSGRLVLVSGVKRP